MATYDDYNRPPPTGGYQEPPTGGYQEPPSVGPRGSSGKALAALLLGLASFCGACFTGVPAVILGFMSLGDIRRSNGRMTGSGMAYFGIITGLLGSLCCTGFWGIGGYSTFVAAPQAMKGVLDSNFVIQQHIGNVQEVSWDFGETMEVAQKNPGKNFVVMAVKGPKGEGIAAMRVEDKGGTPTIVEGYLEMKNGERFDLMGGAAVGDADKEKAPPPPPKPEK